MVIESVVDQSVIDNPPGETRQLIFDSLKAHGDKVYMVDGLTGAKLTYKQLYDKAVSVAISLNKSGIGDGSFVGVLSDVLIEVNIFSVGVWLSGATLCPMNAVLKPGEVRQLLDICKSKFLFCQGKYLAVLESALAGDADETTVITDVSHEKYRNVADMMNEDTNQFQMRSYDPEKSITHVLFTSGTTGVPKGVMCSSRSAKALASGLQIEIQNFLNSSPIYWISYIGIVMWTLLNGTTFIVPRTKYIPGTNDVDLTHILDCIQKYKPYHWFAGPSVLLSLCAIPSSTTYDLSSLGHVVVGGSNLLPSQRRQICDTLFNGRNILFNMYAATEVGVITTWPEGAPDHDSPLAASLGMLSAGVSLKVEDVETGLELGPGEIGELVLKSGGVMTGYMNHDMPRRYSRDDWYRTGDLGSYDKQGYVYFTSRLKEIMKYRGLQISPAELENVVIEHPQVKEVCVVGRPHKIDGERPAAFVVRRSNILSEEELLKFVEERVVDSKKLRGGIFFVESIPKNGVGKTLRKDLLVLFEGMDDE